jgi:hypothetical protein
MRGSTVAFITKYYELLQCFQHDFFLFLVFVLLFFFLKLSLSNFFFNIELIKNLALLFFSLKHCELLQ